MISILTQKQENLLNYIEKRIKEDGRSPSLRQAAKDNGVSHAAISQQLTKLEEKGYIKRDGPYSRNIYLINRQFENVDGIMRWLEIPVIGTIAAGLPLYAQQEWDGSIIVSKDDYHGQNLFALRINGDSMKDAAILNGDLVICEPRQFAENGEIIVALINQEEATVKRYFFHHDHIELCPENPEYSPVSYAFNEVLVQGRVIGLHRKYN